MSNHAKLLLSLSLFVSACSSTVVPAATEDAAAETTIHDDARDRGDSGGVDGTPLGDATPAPTGDATVVRDGGDGGGGDSGGDWGLYCGAACARAEACGWAMPYGCGDWCYPSSFTPYLACIAAAETCDEACACVGGKSCSTKGDGGSGG